MFLLIVFLLLGIAGFLVFAYAAGSGLVVFFKAITSVNWSRKQKILVFSQLLCFLLLTYKFDLVQSSFQFFKNFLSSSQLLLNPNQGTHSFFAHYAPSSHTLCGVLGVLIAGWVYSVVFQNNQPSSPSSSPLPSPSPLSTSPSSSSSSSPSPLPSPSKSSEDLNESKTSKNKEKETNRSSRYALPGINSTVVLLSVFMHLLFFVGCFTWFFLCITPVVKLYEITLTVSFYDALFMSCSHTFAFTMGMFLHRHYHTQRLYERSETEIMQFYTICYLAFISAPKASGMIWDFLPVVDLTAYLPSSLVPTDIPEFLASISFSSVLSSLSSIWSFLYPYIFSTPVLTIVSLPILFFLFLFWILTPIKTDPKQIWTQEDKETVLDYQTHKRALAFPPPYPNGWYKLFRSHEVPVGVVKTIYMLGRCFAVYRLPDKSVHVNDAKSIDGQPLKRWHSHEYANIICVYYTAEEDITPPYMRVPLPEIDSGKFVLGGVFERDVNLHIQDFAENAADYAHFSVLHPNMYTPVFKNIFRVAHNTTWEVEKKEAQNGMTPISYFHDHPHMVIRGFEHHLPETVYTDVTFVGPGGIVYFRFTTPHGDLIIVKTFQPRGPLVQRLQDVWYRDPKVPLLLARFAINEATNAFGDDIFVWANKSYSFKPVLAKGDGPMLQIRRWYKQFYSPNSYTLPALPEFNTHVEDEEKENKEAQSERNQIEKCLQQVEI